METFRKISISILIIYFSTFSFYSPAQTKQELFELAHKARQIGRFDQAESYLHKMLLLKDSVTERNKVAIYNLMGMINDDAGRYGTAIGYYKKASDILIRNFGEDFSILSAIYNNLAISYKMKGDYEKALDYYQIVLYNIDESTLSSKEKELERSRNYLNLGILLMHLKDYPKAIRFFENSLAIKSRYGFKGLENVYINLARAYEKLGNFKKAEIYYQKCIKSWESKKNFDISFIPAAAYKDFAGLLVKSGKSDEAHDYYLISMKVYENTYGPRHPYTANNYLVLGDYYLQLNELDRAIYYYQKSIVANTKKFTDSSIFSLPQVADIISDRQMIKNLKSKSEAFLVFGETKKNKDEKIKILNACIYTTGLAHELITGIRNGYLNQSSKLNITQDEKAFYLIASQASLRLYELSGDEKFKRQAYSFVQKSKASLLSEEIKRNRAFLAILPDSVRELKLQAENDIYSYKKLIYDENQKAVPDINKIKAWSDRLFRMNNAYETLMEKIQSLSPEYKKLTAKSDLLDYEHLIKKLNPGQNIIEYSLSPTSDEGDRKLQVFILSRKGLNYYQTTVGPDFKENIDAVRDQMNNKEGLTGGLSDFNLINEKLYRLYLTLIKPVESYFDGSELFIIPDEEISYLSFDALQKHYAPQKMVNYSALPYLIYDYCISYAYASNLLFPDGPQRKSNYVYAFAPEYEGDGLSNIRFQLGRLENTEKEIKAIFKWFKGEALIGRKANEEFFKGISGEEGIFHFAMHASSEKGNPDFSFLAINRIDSTEEDGFFYNYEIAMMNMRASMVVLSGCNTGDGVISSGEGLMSLSRNFILAGAPSIVHSLWEVQDETSVMVMDKFYEYLSKGIPKNKALYQAKLDYINSVSPAMANPYYWSGYVHIGDPRPLAGYTYFYYLAGVLILLVLIGVTVFIVKKKAVLKRF
jgi:CHAT domain-containing protein/tetratricopeptide (TPR) repeat protein